jgi:acetyltransferase-like isoleucine patch superfamily enzyme
MRQTLGSLYARSSMALQRWAAIGPRTRQGRRFHQFGNKSVICWPPTTILNQEHISIGAHTMIGPHVALSVGMVEGQEVLDTPVVRIGDRCLIGRGSGIVAHYKITIGDDVWTGHHVYITDQNHGYEDLSVPISRQSAPEKEVRIGNRSWIGHGSVILPGVTIGHHVVVGANSVVTRDIPDYCVAVGAPARVIKQFVEGEGWIDMNSGHKINQTTRSKGG